MKEADNEIDERMTRSAKRKRLQEEVYTSQTEYNKKMKRSKAQKADV